MANQYLKAWLGRRAKANHWQQDANLFRYANQPLPGGDTVQTQAFYSPFNTIKMVAGAGFSALASMNTTGNAMYIPQQTRQTLDGYGSGFGAHYMGVLDALSPQSHDVGIYTPATAIYASAQNAGPS